MKTTTMPSGVPLKAGTGEMRNCMEIELHKTPTCWLGIGTLTCQFLKSSPQVQFVPRACMRSKGLQYVIGRGNYLYIYIGLFLEPIFYLPKYSLSEVYSNTDIEFNGLWYSLAARQVFMAIANPDSLSFG